MFSAQNYPIAISYPMDIEIFDFSPICPCTSYLNRVPFKNLDKKAHIRANIVTHTDLIGLMNVI